MASGPQPDDAGATLERVLRLARGVGLVDDSNAEVVADLVERAMAVDVGYVEHALVGLVQAYGRAVDRIVSAEAAVIVRRLTATAPEDFEAELRRLLATVEELSRETYAAIHGRRLEQIVRRRTAAAADVEHRDHHPYEVVELTVAVVDLRGSTTFMLEHEPSAVCDLVDDLYFAAAEIAAEHDVHPGKFMGDGAIFLSSDGDRLLAAARAAVVVLAERTALAAGAGVARGRVVRHAGDWYGTPMNLAARLAELAGPDEVLVDESAVPQPMHERARWRDVLPRGQSLSRRAASF